jgi:hypothetical protein
MIASDGRRKVIEASRLGGSESHRRFLGAELSELLPPIFLVTRTELPQLEIWLRASTGAMRPGLSPSHAPR